MHQQTVDESTKRRPVWRWVLSMCATLMFATSLSAQSTTIRVIDEDRSPVPFAAVSVNGGQYRYANSNGILDASGAIAGKRAEVRRIGYQAADFAIPEPLRDTVEIVIRRLGQRLGAVTVEAQSGPANLNLSGFYRRLLDRQKGSGSGVFIGPEELELRNPVDASSVLRGLNGITLRPATGGGLAALTNNGTCQMPVLVDGARVVNANNGAKLSRTAQAFVLKSLDEVVRGHEIAAVEVYVRGAMVPMELQQPDMICGLVAIWTGSRK